MKIVKKSTYTSIRTFLVVLSSLTTMFKAGVNKKPKKFKTVWHGFWGILKLSGRVNQAGLNCLPVSQILSVGLPKHF